MDLTLSWDLFIIVFFALVIAYSFIIGKKESVKIILSSYVAIIAVQGMGNVMQRIFGFTDAQSSFDILGMPIDTTMMSIVKLMLFVTIVVFLAVRAGFHVQYNKESSLVINMVLTGVSGFATAGLLLATLLTYISGAPLLDMAVTATTPGMQAILSQSTLMSYILFNLDVLFILPAGVLIAAGFLSNQ